MGKWSVGQIQWADINRVGTLPSFNIMDERGRPVLVIGYASDDDAIEARKLITKALENAEFVGVPGP
jgi:hypothetical protein